VQFDVRHVDDGVRALLHNIVLGGSPKIRVGRQSWWEARPLTAPATVGSVVVFYDTTFTSVRAKDTVSFALPSGDFLDREVLEKTDSSVTLTTPLPVDLPLGTYVVPVRFGYITRYPQMDVHPVNVEDMRVEFTTDDDTSVAALSPTEFDTHPVDGLPILKANFIGRGEKRAELSRRTRELDSGTGVMFSSGPESIGQAAVDVLVVLRSEQAVWEWRQFLHYVRGSWGRFYVPTFQNDVPLAEDLPLGEATLTARNTGLKRFLDARAPRRDVRVVTAAGEVYYRRILSVVDNGAVELVTLDQGIPGIGVSPKEKTRVSFMHLSRIDGDVATFTHYRQGRADLEFRTRTVKE
jgi:hypothetical protein